MEIRESDARYLEEQTRLQSECQLWFDHRKGWITASKFGNVKKAKFVNPAAGLARLRPLQSVLSEAAWE